MRTSCRSRFRGKTSEVFPHARFLGKIPEQSEDDFFQNRFSGSTLLVESERLRKFSSSLLLLKKKKAQLFTVLLLFMNRLYYFFFCCLPRAVDFASFFFPPFVAVLGKEKVILWLLSKESIASNVFPFFPLNPLINLVEPEEKSCSRCWSVSSLFKNLRNTSSPHFSLSHFASL